MSDIEANFHNLPPFYAMRMLAEQEQARRLGGQVLQQMYPQPSAQPQRQPMPQPQPMPQVMPPPQPGTMQGGPQAPPPGAASVPMSPVGGGMPPVFPQAGPIGAPPQQMAPPPASIPPFRALPTAAPAPPMTGGQIGAPPAPAPAAPPPAGEGVSQPQGIQLPAVFKAMGELGISPDKTVAMLEAIAPAMNMQNNSELAFTKSHLAAAKAAEQFYKDQMVLSLKGRETTVKEDAEARRGDQGQQRIDVLRTNAETARKRVLAQYGNDGVKQELTPGGMKVAEEMTRAGLPLPGGWSKQGMARGNAILNYMAEHEEGGAGSGAVVGSRTESKSNQLAMNQVTKDLAALRPYKKMLDMNTSILGDLAEKVIATDSELANKPINWLRTHTTDSDDLNEYLFQMNTVVTESARVLNNPRLVGQLTDSARKDMQEVINGNFPLNSTRRILARMVKDGLNRVTSMEEEKARLKGDISSSAAVPNASSAAKKNAKGWVLMTDKNGNKAYVSPDKTQFEAVH